MSNVAHIIEFVPRETFISCGSLAAMREIADSVPAKFKEVLIEQKGMGVERMRVISLRMCDQLSA